MSSDIGNPKGIIQQQVDQILSIHDLMLFHIKNQEEFNNHIHMVIRDKSNIV